jgi:hypothetical protein
LEVLGDSAYGGGATRAALRAAGHLQTIKPIPRQSAVPGGFTIHDFRTDRSAGTLRCPAGLTTPITSSGRVSFARECPSCPLRRRCTTAKQGRMLVADGCRRVPYRGIERNQLWWSLRVAAVNLRRLLAVGLRRQGEAWDWPDRDWLPSGWSAPGIVPHPARPGPIIGRPLE